ncbi:MAG: hypothetical protein AAF367_08250 [Pseudomonadota bacterium]
MVHIVDYKVLRDAPISISGGQSKEVGSFLPPSDIVNSSGSQRAVLHYLVSVNASNSILRIDLKFANVKIKEHIFADQGTRGLWEVFRPGFLGDGPVNNTFDFECLAGQVTISDVIVWYQRNIPV